MNASEVKDILVINPGSTSTKITIYTKQNTEILYENNIVHDEQKILEFPTVASQKNYRKGIILDELNDKGYDLKNLTAVVGRGGMLFGLKGGGYKINDKMYNEMASSKLPQHASSLGALLAYSIAQPLGIPSFIYDSTMGCDLLDIAKVTGISEIEKYGATHLLNSRAQAIKYAKSKGKDYKEMNFINCHMGGGITANAMKGGKVIDTAAYDDGPMAPERSGGVPLLLFKQLCFDGKHTEEDMEKLIAGKGGLYSYLGTKDAREVEKMIEEGDSYAAMVYEAMGFQVAKAIAGLSCALEGKVDVIILTGGVAYSKWLTEKIKKYCGHIAPIEVMPGESEMEALAAGTLRMLTGEEEIKEL
ncbi:butyrate kinase [Clostridiales Family XIII bacterium WCA-MUC-591-APC-3H]|uniref:Probable butyrate kinase n=1 Tax=Hornefia butyriciproducens TaxID=2652293 RepID=A0A6L5Y637_9FIRM|nr:butyrate kinase [Hornefia butyriciproducens]